MPLVLVQNPVIIDQEFDWKDILGEQYHFPNKYRNRCRTGTPFIYYRGTRRPGGKRAEPEYFGYGTIGDVWRDTAIAEASPKKNWAWYCRILDYAAFQTPVRAKIAGEFLEKIPRNHWSEGIRTLPQETFNRILELAECAPVDPAKLLILPDLHMVQVQEADVPLLVPRQQDSLAIGSDNSVRYSRTALPVGRRAEEIAQCYLAAHASSLGARKIRWIVNEGSTPGWDLQYENENGELVAVEVKGTMSPRFANVELTAGEWKAAAALGDHYWLYLVADCCTLTPRIQRLQNPAQLVKSGGAVVVPTMYRFAALRRILTP